VNAPSCPGDHFEAMFKNKRLNGTVSEISRIGLDWAVFYVPANTV